jgi:hypothetical protein
LCLFIQAAFNATCSINVGSSAFELLTCFDTGKKAVLLSGEHRIPSQGIISRALVILRSTSRESFGITAAASRVGLTPSPTCQTGQGGLPQGDAAEIGNETVAREASPPTRGLFYVREDSELPTSEEKARAD